MAVTIHVANFVMVQIDSFSGEVFTKETSPMSDFRTNQQKPTTHSRSFSTETRVQPDGGIASTAGYPTLKTYLEAEAALGFSLVHLDQTYVITQK